MWHLNTVFKQHTALTLRQFSQCAHSTSVSSLCSLYFRFLNVTFPSTLQLFLKLHGTGFEVLTLFRTHNATWVRKTTVWCMVMNVLDENSKCIFRGSQMMSEQKPLYPPFRLYSPITQNPTILKLNILHLSYEVWLLYLLQRN